MRERRRSLERIVHLWLGLFREHNLLTYASAIAFQTFIAFVALALLGLGVLGATGGEEVWTDTIAPEISGRVLPDVYRGIDAIVRTVFSSSSVGLIVFASALAVWEVSGVVRAAGGALNTIYETEETRAWWVRFPVSFALAGAVIVTVIGAVFLVGVVDVPGGWGWPARLGRWVGAIALLVVAFSMIVRWAPAENRARRWATFGAMLVVAGWIGEMLVVRWYVQTYASFRSPIGSLELFIFAAGLLYVASIILLVGLELDELVREDLEETDRSRRLLPLLRGVMHGETPARE
jgi:membrane protein